MYAHLSTCCNKEIKSIKTEDLDENCTEAVCVCTVCKRPIGFDYRVLHGLANTKDHSISGAAYELKDCCGAVVMANENEPPESGYLDCICGERIHIKESTMTYGLPPDSYSIQVIQRGDYASKD